MFDTGLEVGRRGSRESAQHSNPIHQRESPARTMLCWLKALGPSGSLWLPLYSLSLIQDVVLACTVGDQRLSSPALGCLGSVFSFCSLKSLHRLLQSIFLQKRAPRLEITLSLLLLTPAASRRFNPGRGSLPALPGWWQEPSCPPFGHLTGPISPQLHGDNISQAHFTSPAQAEEPGSFSRMARR